MNEHEAELKWLQHDILGSNELGSYTLPLNIVLYYSPDADYHWESEPVNNHHYIGVENPSEVATTLKGWLAENNYAVKDLKLVNPKNVGFMVEQKLVEEPPLNLSNLIDWATAPVRAKSACIKIEFDSEGDWYLGGYDQILFRQDRPDQFKVPVEESVEVNGLLVRVGDKDLVEGEKVYQINFGLKDLVEQVTYKFVDMTYARYAGLLYRDKKQALIRARAMVGYEQK